MSTVNIGGIVVSPGEQAFGTIERSKTVKQLTIGIPINDVNRAEEVPLDAIDPQWEG